MTDQGIPNDCNSSSVGAGEGETQVCRREDEMAPSSKIEEQVEASNKEHRKDKKKHRHRHRPHHHILSNKSSKANEHDTASDEAVLASFNKVLLEVLSDGTRTDGTCDAKYEEKKTLPDGSTIIRRRSDETAQPSNVAESNAVDGCDGPTHFTNVGAPVPTPK